MTNLFGEESKMSPGKHQMTTVNGLRLKGEEITQYLSCEYIRRKYRDLPFYGAATANVSIGKGGKDNRNAFYLPKKMLALGANPDWTDIIVPVPASVSVFDHETGETEYYRSGSLCVELKHHNAPKPWVRNFTEIAAIPHYESQAKFHEKLNRNWSAAMFCIGDTMFQRILDDYLKSELRLRRFTDDKRQVPIKFLVPEFLLKNIPITKLY